MLNVVVPPRYLWSCRFSRRRDLSSSGCVMDDVASARAGRSGSCNAVRIFIARSGSKWPDRVWSRPGLCSIALCSWKYKGSGYSMVLSANPGNTRGGSITVPLTSCLTGFGNSCMTTDNFCFYLQNRLIWTSKTGGQRYSDTYPLVFPGQSFY